MTNYTIKRPTQSVEFEEKTIVVLPVVQGPFAPEGVQAFYRSSQRGSEIESHWRPFNSVGLASRFDNHRFGQVPEGMRDPLFRYGTPENKFVCMELGAMEKNGDIPKPIRVNKEAVNVFIGTKESLEANARFKSVGDAEEPTAGIRPSRDAHAHGGREAGVVRSLGKVSQALGRFIHLGKNDQVK
jgi:hypothetical protein